MKTIRAFGLLTLVCLLLAACAGLPGGGPGATPSAIATPQTLPATVSPAVTIAQGQVVPHQRADLSFNATGKVAEVLAQEGDTVQAGQVIARLVNSQAVDSTAASAQKAAAVANAQQAVAAAQQQVATAQKAELAAETELVNARKAITDMLDATTETLNMAQVESNIADLQKQIDDAQRNLGYLVSPDVKYYQDQVKRAQDALTNAQQNITLVDISQLQVQLRNAQTALTTATNVYNNAKDGFADCPSCEKVWAYDRMINWQDAQNLYTDANNLVQQLQLQIDQSQRGGSLNLSTAQDNLKTATNRLDYFLQGPDAIKVNQNQANLSLMQARLAKTQNDAAKLKANNGVDPDALKAAQDRVAAAQASLIAAQATLATAQTAVPAAQANLVSAQVQQDSVELKAPFAGTIAMQNLRVGEYVIPSQAVTTLADLSQWDVQTTDLTEFDVVKIQVGQTVALTLDALPDVQLAGKVKSIRPKYEAKSGAVTYTVTIALTGTNPQMHWGMTAEVIFPK
jgi:HlyD family secretion protein